ncbi:MAG: NADH-quinone oxidoreductase subunit C [Candidatus Omnitrophica bacterium]|nr:NADH-quinone oxidoreductase subunit C [Candidatus Omnitrophota bacterium]
MIMNLIEAVTNKFPDLVICSHSQHGDQTVIIRKEGLGTLMKFLKYDPQLDFNILMDITAVDYLNYPPSPLTALPHGEKAREGACRFEMVYHLYSLKYNHRLRVKAPVELEAAQIDSLAELWPVADWFEREVWDMFGIRFKGHPNLKRLLMYEEFEGHPLRKDYPYNKRQPIVVSRESSVKASTDDSRPTTDD